MNTDYPFKLVKWFFLWILIIFIFGVFSLDFIDTYFLDDSTPSLVWGFILGFFICAFTSAWLYFRVLKMISKANKKVNAIVKGKMDLRYDDSFTKEPGEFYDLYKNLNKIDENLRSQKKIITQESSELEAVISAVQGAIIAVDESQKVLFFNREAVVLFQKNNQASSEDLFLSEWLRNPDIIKCYEDCLKTGKIVKKKIEINLFEPEGDLIYQLSVAPLKQLNSQIQGAVGLFYDITNLKKTEKLHIAFISNVSHELRTPLTAIQGYVETLILELKNNNTEVMGNFLQIIKRNVERLVSLLNHFLELSQLEASSNIKKQTVSTEKITNSIVKDLHIKNHKLNFKFEAKEVVADPHFLKQILYNLLDNATRYVPKGRLIEVLWSQDDSAVVLTVKDHGEGIHRRHQDRLFEKFYRVDQARTKKSDKVSGIGLSIVKELVERHGGTIKLVSQENEGSQFICSFPNN